MAAANNLSLIQRKSPKLVSVHPIPNPRPIIQIQGKKGLQC